MSAALRRSGIVLAAMLGAACTATNPVPGGGDDAYPVLVTDYCGMPGQSRTIFFRQGSDQPVATGIERQLPALLQQLREDGGYVLLEGHMDAAEVRRADLRQLDRRRAEFVRDWLVSHGISRFQVWITGKGGDEPLVPTAAGVGHEENRRVVVLPTHAGAACESRVRRERLEWFHRNCFPVAWPGKRRDCARALYDLR